MLALELYRACVPSLPPCYLYNHDMNKRPEDSSQGPCRRLRDP